MRHIHTIEAGRLEEYWVNTDRSISVYGYENIKTHKRVYTVWKDDAIPADDFNVSYLDFAFLNGNFENPVAVDVITGRVYEIPKEQWSREGKIYRFTGIPVYDGPVLIADQSLIKFQ